LEIFRLDGDLNDFRPIAEPLGHVIDDALDGLGASLREKNLTVTISPKGEGPAVLADPRGLRTVLSNLLQNAIATSPRDGEIRIDAVERGERIEITIADDGEGVDPAEIPRLLRPFEQGDSVLTRNGEGAGLGLPIARLLCRNMRGSLRLRCSPGHGLEAIVVLPAGRD
jgi:signal transduction histidine kinase